MKLRSSSLIIGFGLSILLALAVWKAAEIMFHFETEKVKAELLVEKAKSSGLKDSVEVYKKAYHTEKTYRVKATKTITELRNKNLRALFKIRPDNIIKSIDSVSVKDSIITTKDFYPNKENKFITYSSSINIEQEKGIGKFEFEPFSMELSIEQQENGMYDVTTALPDFLKITSVEVKSNKAPEPKNKDFGWLIGVGGGKGKGPVNDYMSFSTGFRYKTLYFNIQATTNSTLGGGIHIEL